MATLNNKFMTLLDLAQLPENGQAMDVINLLSQFNPMLHDAPAILMNRNEAPHNADKINKSNVSFDLIGRILSCFSL